jgi:hypothetical protein
LVTKLGKDEASAASAAASLEATAKSAPLDPGAGLGEHEVKAILDYKRKRPSMGPAQIRAQLKRFLGWRVSVKAIARVIQRPFSRYPTYQFGASLVPRLKTVPM